MEEHIHNPKDQEQNPIGGELNVEVSIPQKFEIKMVDASSLNDYEIWVFLASLICNFLVGFLVATFSVEKSLQKAFIAFDALCALLLIAAVIMAFIKRKKMSIEKKTINLGLKKTD